MFLSNRFTSVLILVTVFSYSIKSTWCATIVTSDSAKKINLNENAHSNSPSQTVSSSYSITPGYAYQFYTNDNEHLDRLVSAHQNPSSIDSNGSPSQHRINSANPPANSFCERRMDETKTVTDLPLASSSASSAPYNGFDFSAYQQGWKSKEQPDFLSVAPKVVISQGNDYLSQEGLLRDYSMKGKDASPALALLQKPITIIKSEQVVPASNSSVYSTRLPTGTPIMYQGQQKVHTAASYSSPMPKVEGDEAKSTFAFAPVRLQRKRPEKRKILQSRQDTVEVVAEDQDAGAGDAAAGAAGAPGGAGGGVGYEADEDGDHLHYYDHDGDDHYGHSHGHVQGAPGQSESYDHDHDHDEQEDMSNDSDNGYGYYGDNGNGGANDLVELHDNDPAIRDFGQGGGGGPFVGGDHAPIGIGAGAPGPPGLPPPGFGSLPPPPVPLKGSIDYILIPLILIGLAGPIFVVLYVIFGGFEYRLAPIVRRSLETSYVDYEPYINAVTSSVGRALDKYECVDYAACRFRGFCNQVFLDNVTTSNIETVLNSMTPKNYQPTLNSVFSYLKTPEEEKAEDCRQYKCSVLADKLPL